MANTFLTSSVIARQALANLYSTTVAAALVNRDYDNEFQAGRGDTITVRKPTVFAVNDFAGSITVQEATESSVAVVLDEFKDVSFAVTSKEMTLDILDFNQQLLQPAMEAMSQQIDSDVLVALQAAAVAGGNSAGALAAAIDADTIVDARTVLVTNKSPLQNLSAVWGADAEGGLLKDPLFSQANTSGTTEALRNANLGRTFQVENYTDQNVPVATGGTEAGGGLVFHRNAVILASRSLAPAQGADSTVVTYKGFGLRVTIDYDIDAKQDVVSVDTLYGTATAYEELAVEVLGGPSV